MSNARTTNIAMKWTWCFLLPEATGILTPELLYNNSHVLRAIDVDVKRTAENRPNPLRAKSKVLPRS